MTIAMKIAKRLRAKHQQQTRRLQRSRRRLRSRRRGNRLRLWRRLLNDNRSRRRNISRRIIRRRRFFRRRRIFRRRTIFIITIIIVSRRDRSSPPRELAVNSIMAILFRNFTFQDIGAVTEGRAKLVTIKAGDVGTQTSDMTRLMTFTTCGDLPIMFYANQMTTETQKKRNRFHKLHLHDPLPF